MEGTVGEIQLAVSTTTSESESESETEMSATTSDPEPEVSIEIEESWVESVSSRVDASFVPRWRKERCSIFRVPANLRALHPEAYEPRVVSIGPYHHGKAHLKPMETHKWRMVRRLLSRRREEDLLSKCLRKVKTLEERARSCYSEVIDMGSNEFVEMMVLDGCFIIGILLRQRSETIKRKNPYTEATTMEDDDDWVWQEQKDEEEAERGAMHSSLYLLELVDHDLLKVENQMPFFVVEALFNLLVLQPNPITIYDLAVNRLRKENLASVTISNPKVLHFFHIYYMMVARYRKSQDTEKSSSCVHDLINLVFLKIKSLLLHLHNAFPISLIPRNKDSKWKEDWSSGWIKSAKELEEAGVKFKVKRRSRFLDVSFKGGVMEFPSLASSSIPWIASATSLHSSNATPARRIT
ncbi:UPF0481 protein [Acorus calamus]|uniref:UPF0481 protein n=1 Tax=Acorus calamus TaxID=4465 RepID=A0AAV9F414_ACOCL|nr:UPF0481 protein [Acorus calamus]